MVVNLSKFSLLNRGFSSSALLTCELSLILSFDAAHEDTQVLLPSAFLISSALAIESITQIPIIAKALPTADVSAFSIAAVLLINHSHHLA
jgi:hypothetical protein